MYRPYKRYNVDKLDVPTEHYEQGVRFLMTQEALDQLYEKHSLGYRAGRSMPFPDVGIVLYSREGNKNSAPPASNISGSYRWVHLTESADAPLELYSFFTIEFDIAERMRLAYNEAHPDN